MWANTVQQRLFHYLLNIPLQRISMKVWAMSDQYFHCYNHLLCITDCYRAALTNGDSLKTMPNMLNDEKMEVL